jgi:plasmid segregation protein ParM
MATVIGLDLGRSALKLVACWGDESRLERTRLSFPSAVAPARRLVGADAAKAAHSETVVIDGQAYFIGRTASLQAGDRLQGGFHDQWLFTAEHAALLKGALDKAAAAGVPKPHSAEIVVGLAGRSFVPSNDEYLAALRRHLPDATTTVFPQPLGPFFQMLLDEEGREARPELLSQKWIVVEIGQFTTDFALLVEGSAIEERYASANGMRRVAEQLGREIALSKGITNLTMPELTETLKTGTIEVMGSHVPVGDELQRAAQPLAHEILESASVVMGDYMRRANGVLVAGGGAPLMYPLLSKEWKHAVLADDPRFSVAEGFVRAGIHTVFASAAAA